MARSWAVSRCKLPTFCAARTNLFTRRTLMPAILSLSSTPKKSASPARRKLPRNSCLLRLERRREIPDRRASARQATRESHHARRQRNDSQEPARQPVAHQVESVQRTKSSACGANARAAGRHQIILTAEFSWLKPKHLNF